MDFVLVVWVLMIGDVPVTCSVSVWFYSCFCQGEGLACVNSKFKPMVFEEFCWKVGFLVLVVGIVSWSERMIDAPGDSSFDVLWKVVYGSSGNLY